MSKLTIVARPYAKAAFDVAVEQKALDSWATMLFFAAEVAKTTEVAFTVTRFRFFRKAS